MGQKAGIVFTGFTIGVLALALSVYGNPANMGLCIACFLRDTAGALGLHQAKQLQYIRPEILGIILGAFAAALSVKEFRVVGGSNRIVRFVLGVTMMVGMLIFLGCPLRVALRLGAGDLNALVGFAGLFAGVGAGTYFLKSGFSLGKAEEDPQITGFLLPGAALVVLGLFLAVPALFYFSKQGPGSMHAPVLLSLIAGALIGILAQRTRFCLAGGLRDALLFRNFDLLLGFCTIVVVTLVGSMMLGKFKLGFAAQPIAHSETIWNFLGLMLAGWSAVLLGGCPLRQLILAGQGNTDSAVTVLGLLAGAAAAHGLGLAASAKGVPVNGMYALLVGLAVVLLVSVVPAFRITAVKGGRSYVGN